MMFGHDVTLVLEVVAAAFALVIYALLYPSKLDISYNLPHHVYVAIKERFLHIFLGS